MQHSTGLLNHSQTIRRGELRGILPPSPVTVDISNYALPTVESNLCYIVNGVCVKQCLLLCTEKSKNSIFYVVSFI
jgi:hypothetical protein